MRARRAAFTPTFLTRAMSTRAKARLHKRRVPSDPLMGKSINAGARGTQGLWGLAVVKSAYTVSDHGRNMA
jgi:hypothetical protein